MEDTIQKEIGYYILAVIIAGMSFVEFYLAKITNGCPPELTVLFASLLGSTQVIVIFIVKYYFKISDEEYHERLGNKSVK